MTITTHAGGLWSWGHEGAKYMAHKKKKKKKKIVRCLFASMLLISMLVR